MNDGKDCYMGHLSCKGHTARTDKDLYRICPSKLNKRELEDLYFALLEQNVQLKKTINEQREQIKLLNTKVQRMTAQKQVAGVGGHNRDCCAGAKAIINEQKESIADLKKANERLSERLRLLNMRLCSAKQFLRRGSSQVTSHCSKCLVSCASIKNSSMSALNAKESDAKLVIGCSPCQIEQDNINIQLTEFAVPTPLIETAAPTQLTEIAAPTQLTEIVAPTQLTEIVAPTPLTETAAPTQWIAVAAPTQLTEMAAPTPLTETAAPTQWIAVAAPTQLTEMAAPTPLTEIVVPKPLTEMTATTQLVENAPPTQLAEVTSSRAEISVPEVPCPRDECRAEIDELKLKIIALEEEVCTVRQSHSERMRSLEVAQAQCRLHSERRPDRTDSRQQTDELATQLQQQHARICDLREADRIDGTDRATTCPTNYTLPLIDESVSDSPEPGSSKWGNGSPVVLRNNSGLSIYNEEKHKNSDDSGFTDCKNPDLGEEKERTLQERDDIIENQIANVQSQLVYLKVNAATEAEPQVGVVLGAESSLSHDIFSTSRLKTLQEFDKVPSSSNEADILVSNDRIDDEIANSDQPLKYENQFQYNIPATLTLDMPRIVEPRNTDSNIKNFGNEALNNNSNNRKSSKDNIKSNLDSIKQSKQELIDGDKNTIIDTLDKSNQIIQEIIEERKTNNSLKKNRRSSLKPPYDGKQNRDLAVRYGDTQTYKSSTKSETNVKTVSQGTDVDKVYINPEDDHESDPSVQYKFNDKVSIRRIRYMNDVQTDPYMVPAEKSPGVDPANNGTQRNGAHGVVNDIGIQCLRDLTPEGSCYGEQIVSVVRNDAVTKEAIANVDPNNPVLCAGLSRVCECPSGSVPGPVYLRTCSGASVSTAPPCRERYRACACGYDPLLRLSLPEACQTSPKYLNSALEPHETSPEDHQSSPTPRPTSSDRTDCDASSLTEHVVYPSTHDTRDLDYRSPGEEKATSTMSESYLTTDVSLSEGEVPAARSKRLSATVDNMTDPVWSSRSDKMEEALRAISEELTLCRELLQGRGEQSSESLHRGRETPSFALRRAEGACRMRDSYTPKCIFTLHVGTVVLADQAAAAARGRWLQASWQLYRQAASSTRALRGRVFNYDCTTHYDLKITDHFLYYLKHEEMPIIISEMDKPDEVFATCSLPLRDALLHPNRRVDMSLALVPCGGGEEAGVLDVWCSLRVDAVTLPAINTAIVKPSSLKSQHHSSTMLEQILEDDQPSDLHFTRDLHLQRSKVASEDDQSYQSDNLDKEPELRCSYNDVIENEVPTNIRTAKDFKQAVAKKSNDATSIYEMLKNKRWNRRNTIGSQKNQDRGRQKSVTICNQTSCSSMDRENISEPTSYPPAEEKIQSLDITILWLALNEDCKAMSDPSVKKLYVAYSFLGRSGADLETPISLPKPEHYMDKCHFLYKKTFLVSECEMLTLGRLACCMPAAGDPDPSRAVVFSVVSEPADDPLGLSSCEDIGYAYLYLGDVLARSAESSYTALLEVKTERGAGCGALAVRLDGLALLRHCRELAVPPVSTGVEHLNRPTL